MEAIRVDHFGEPEVLRMETIPAPTLETDTQVLVEILAAGVNPVDTYIRAGTYGRLPCLPYTPGVDGAGRVLAVGAAVKDLQVGDRVYGGWPQTGTYAQIARYDRPWVYPLPSHLSFEQGACLFVPYSTAYRALFEKGRAQPGDRVLIHGATGAVGLAAVQLALAAGLSVIGTGGSTAGRDLVAKQGDAVVLDHHSVTYSADLSRATRGEGVTIILEMLANLNLNQDLTWLAPAGRVVVVGSRGEITIDPRHILSREIWVTGINLFSSPPETLHRIQKALYAGLINRSLSPIVNQCLPLQAAATAHRQVLSNGARGNRVLLPPPLSG